MVNQKWRKKKEDKVIRPEIQISHEMIKQCFSPCYAHDTNSHLYPLSPHPQPPQTGEGWEMTQCQESTRVMILCQNSGDYHNISFLPNS